MDIEAARRYFATAIMESDVVSELAEISIRNDPKLGEAAVFHCRWPLVDKGPYSGNYSREITVQMKSGAMNKCRVANPRERGAMSIRFVRIFNARLLDGQYDGQDSSSPAFVISIDEHSLNA